MSEMSLKWNFYRTVARNRSNSGQKIIAEASTCFKKKIDLGQHNIRNFISQQKKIYGNFYSPIIEVDFRKLNDSFLLLKILKVDI